MPTGLPSWQLSQVG